MSTHLPNFGDVVTMQLSKIQNLIALGLVALSLATASTAWSKDEISGTSPAQHAAATKARLVLMPLRVGEELQGLHGAMETALINGLQEKFIVFAGEQVSQKAREIFLKESRSAAKKECDETRCMQNIAEAFQAELLAIANITKRENVYFIALTVENIFDNKIELSKSVTCPSCDASQLVDKLSELFTNGHRTTAADEFTDWLLTKENNSIEGYQLFIKRYPAGKYYQQASEMYWTLVAKTNTPDAYQGYLKLIPEGEHASVAIDALWGFANKSDTIEGYQEFLKNNPKNKYAAQAQNEIDRLVRYGMGKVLEDSGPYVVIEAGYSTISTNDAELKTGLSNTSAGVLLGYKINPYFSVEGGGKRLGIDGDGFKAASSAYWSIVQDTAEAKIVTVVGRYSMNKRLALLGKVGMASVSVNDFTRRWSAGGGALLSSNVSSYSATTLTYGGGIEADLFKHVAMRLTYNKFTAPALSRIQDISELALGLQFIY